jgi:hypothetical protein
MAQRRRDVKLRWFGRRRARRLAARSLRLACRHCFTLISVAVLAAAGLVAVTSDAFISEGPARGLPVTARDRAGPATQQHIGLAWLPPSDTLDLRNRYDVGLGGMPPLNAIDAAKAAAYFQTVVGPAPQN